MNIIKPDVFHIGIPKSGSTSIQDFLKNDERILITRSRFYTGKAWWGNPKIIKNSKEIVIESNETLISGGFQKVKFSQTVERFHRINPKAKIVLVIRNQPKAVMSMYKYHVKNAFYGIKNFQHWMLNTDLGIDYLSLCLYGNILNVLLSYFPKNQIQVLLFEELKENPEAFYDKLYSTLDLSLNSTNFKKSNVNSFNDKQLYSLVLLNYFSFFKRKSENPYFSSLGYKIEQKIKKGIVRRFNITPRKNFFSWERINIKDEIYNDFRYTNKKVVDLGFLTEAELIKYNYLFPKNNKTNHSDY